jgi:hypothetical protein
MVLWLEGGVRSVGLALQQCCIQTLTQKLNQSACRTQVVVHTVLLPAQMSDYCFVVVGMSTGVLSCAACIGMHVKLCVFKMMWLCGAWTLTLTSMCPAAAGSGAWCVRQHLTPKGLTPKLSWSLVSCCIGVFQTGPLDCGSLNQGCRRMHACSCCCPAQPQTRSWMLHEYRQHYDTAAVVLWRCAQHIRGRDACHTLLWAGAWVAAVLPVHTVVCCCCGAWQLPPEVLVNRQDAEAALMLPLSLVHGWDTAVCFSSWLGHRHELPLVIGTSLQAMYCLSGFCTGPCLL